MFSKLLIPVVDTPISQHGAQIALEFAWRLGAGAVVFHVTTAPDSQSALNLLSHWEKQAAPELRLETMLAQSSDAPRAIADAAQAAACDLIVMGTHAREGLGRLLIGSVAEKVLQQSPLPIMLVRKSADATATQRFHRLLLPLDSSEGSQQALGMTISLAKRLGASLTLLHVVPEPPLPTGDFMGAGYALSNWDEDSTLQRQQGEELLRAAKTQAVAIEVNTHLLVAPQAEVGHVIVETARNENADLIIMSTQARRGLDRLLLGSVAEQVAHHAEAPVLLMRASLLKSPEPTRANTITATPGVAQ